MKSTTISALGIAFKIWLFAVAINTAGDTLLFGSTGPFFVNAIMLIALFGGIFSAPVFLLLWALLYNLLHAGKPANYIFKILLLTGVGLAIATWAVFAWMFSFFDKELIYMAAIAPVSGAIAICINYRNIKNTCYERDAGNNMIETFGAETASPQT